MCSFCGKPRNIVNHLFHGDRGASICDFCLNDAIELSKQSCEHYNEARMKKALKPQEIYEHLDQYIIGQTAAKKSLSVAVYNHYKRINPFESSQQADNSVEIQKSNVLLLGPTGTGKTYLAQTLARIMGVPFIIVDATALTQAGYVGEDVESILLRLIQEANNDIELASKGIVYIDEVDKLARRSDTATSTKDVSGEGVQQGLLKIIEGTKTQVQPNTGRKTGDQNYITIDTTDILFIASGAFSGLEEIVHNRVNKASVGFGAPIKRNIDTQSSIFMDTETEDLHKFGLIPEFIGRFPIITYADPLDVEDLKKILVEPKNSIIKQYQKLFELDGVKLEFTPEALDEIAKIAIDKKNGARSLKSVVERILEPIMFEIPSRNDIKTITIDKEHINSPLDAFSNILENPTKTLAKDIVKND